MWTLGVGSDRSLGRPKGTASPVVSTTIGCLGFLEIRRGSWEESVNMGQPFVWATLAPREKIVARGVASALRALVGGKALSYIRHHPEIQNGFEMWRLFHKERLLHKEYIRDTATRKVGLLKRVLDDQPTLGVDFGDWFLAQGLKSSTIFYPSAFEIALRLHVDEGFVTERLPSSASEARSSMLEL